MKLSKTGLLVLAAAVISGSSMVSAQDQDADANALTIEEVIVTAQKREETLMEIPISIKALSAETLAEINARSLADITRLVPSMSMTDLSRGGNNVQIRGLGSNVGSVGTVALYNDGIIAATRSQSNGTFAEQDSSLYDVERVEVLRGPQGTLYGEGSFGGVINIISNRPDPEQFSASASASMFKIKNGSSGNYDVAAMLNIPLSDKWAIRVVGNKSDRDGYIDAVNVLPVFFGLPAEFVAEDANTEKVTSARVLLGYTGEKVDATLIVKSEKINLGINNFTSPRLIELANSFFGTTFDPDLSQAIFSSDFGTESQVDEVVLDINVDTSGGVFTSLTSWAEVDAVSTGAISLNEAFSQEFRLSSDRSGSINYTVGAYYRDADRSVELTGGFPFVETSLEQWSVFGQLYWDISETLTATVGMRYGEFKSAVTDTLNGLPTAQNDFEDVSPKVALNWQPSESTMSYVSIAKGFRAGGANVDVSLGTDPNFSQGFDSDEIWNYEIGLKKIFLDGRLSINTALFYIDWKDIQIDKPVNNVVNPPTSFIVVNGDKAHSYGIEVDMYWNPGEGWDIVLGGSLLEAQFDGGSIDSPFGTFLLDGMTLPSAPEFLFNASVTKTFPISSGADGFIRADYSHRGNSFADVPNEAPGVEFRSGTFDLINLRAGVHYNNWEFQLYATNLTNQDATAWDWFDGFFHFRALIQPRTYGLNVKFRYN